MEKLLLYKTQTGDIAVLEVEGSGVSEDRVEAGFDLGGWPEDLGAYSERFRKGTLMIWEGVVYETEGTYEGELRELTSDEKLSFLRGDKIL